MIVGALGTALRKIGIPLPFGGIICPEVHRIVYIEGDWRARVITRRTLVFTRNPRPGDLHDRFPVEPGSPLEILFYDSPDAIEVGRKREKHNTLAIGWMPKQPVTRYALYTHEDTWMYPGSHKRSAVAAHYRCDMKTGTVGMEFITPGVFEAGVAFRRPRWRLLRSERQLMKFVLRELHANATAHPRIDDGGKRAYWRFEGPKRGDNFVFVLFHEHGVVEWERRLSETSIFGRARRLLGRFA